MILDNQSFYANAQAVTAVGDTASSNSVDHGPGNAGVGLAGSVLVVSIFRTFLSGGAATLQTVLQDSADNTAWTDVETLTPATPVAALTARKVLVQARFPSSLRRYTRVVFRVAGAVMTDGAISVALTAATDAQQSLPSGFRVNA